MNKALEGENGRLSSEATRVTLLVSPVAQPPHQSLAGEVCGGARLTCVHVHGLV
jgi:hypothetical protein